MSNQRKESRKKLMAFTPVYDLRSKTLLGYVGDLTLKGVMVIGEKTIETDAHLVLGIEFPESGADSSVTRMVIPARVAWIRQDESPQYFNIGFEFGEVSPENADLLKAIIERYKFRSALESNSEF
ncbi:MAG: PilZ domain-containing protein [Anaerolineales bacterium]|nr:PilZ domain-containing protein [Anaerolineales bacterium]